MATPKYEYCNECGSILLMGGCSNKNCIAHNDYGIQSTQANPKRKGWKIDNVFMDFNKPVTYDEALASYHRMKEKGEI